jgi:hypothetical protein
VTPGIICIGQTFQKKEENEMKLIDYF